VTGAPPIPATSRWLAAALFLVIVALFAVRNLPWHLDNYDQAKQAFTSYEMIQEGHWWFQHTPTGKVATKPPLAGWISAGLYVAMGRNWWDVAWRLPSFASALIILALLWRSGNALFGPWQAGGLLAVGAWGLNVFTPRLATLVRTDMLLTLAIFLAGWLVLRKVQRAEAWTTAERWGLCLVVLASMLIKGPIAYAFLLPGLVAYAVCARRLRLPNHSWAGVWPWFVPLLAFGAWVGIGIWSGGGLTGDFYQQVVQKEFLGRFTVGEKAVHNNQPIYFYLAHILAKFAPWSLLLIAFAVVKPARAALRTDPALLWLVCWALGGLVLMSLVPSKRFDRILPVIPPLCLLLPAFARYAPVVVRSRWVSVGAPVLALVIAASYALSETAKGHALNQRMLVEFGRDVQQIRAGRPFEVVIAEDEAMVIYTSQTRYLRMKEALKKWRNGEVEALVLPRSDLEKHAELLAPYECKRETRKGSAKYDSYAFIERPPSWGKRFALPPSADRAQPPPP